MRELRMSTIDLKPFSHTLAQQRRFYKNLDPTIYFFLQIMLIWRPTANRQKRLNIASWFTGSRILLAYKLIKKSHKPLVYYRINTNFIYSYNLHAKVSVFTHVAKITKNDFFKLAKA